HLNTTATTTFAAQAWPETGSFHPHFRVTFGACYGSELVFKVHFQPFSMLFLLFYRRNVAVYKL
ncbi:hypothetical protein ABK046_47740, partial [Streptomyces caeruleatus]